MEWYEGPCTVRMPNQALKSSEIAFLARNTLEIDQNEMFGFSISQRATHGPVSSQDTKTSTSCEFGAFRRQFKMYFVALTTKCGVA